MSDSRAEAAARCGWQGYGFGASYQDAACCDGIIGDLDDCEEPGGPIGLRDETCPQCGGTGVAKREVGPMALIRQRALAGCVELCEMVEDEELRKDLITRFEGYNRLVNELEGNE